MKHSEQKMVFGRIPQRRDPFRFLFPERCPLCDGLLKRREGPVCRMCGESLRITRLDFRNGFAPFPYSGVYRDAVRRFKYSGRPSYAPFFADAILLAGREQIERWDPEWIVPVPVHPARRRQRGYNQAEEAAAALAGRLKLPCRPDLVIRKKNTLPQNGLSPEERRRNLEGAFAVKKGKTSARRVLLVDDIYTTGSTIMELEKILRACGAQEVFAVCVCVALS